MAEYIVLKIGIFVKILFIRSISFFPINESESHPINVMKIIVIKISIPGISIFR